MPREQIKEGFRLVVDGSWTANDFSLMLRGLDDLYNITTILSNNLLKYSEIREEAFPLDRRKIRRIALRSGDAGPLAVQRISYASPGFADIGGIGKAVREVRLLVFGVIDRFLDHKKRKLENEHRELANQRLKIELDHLNDQVHSENRRKEQLHNLSVATKKSALIRSAEETRTLMLRNMEKELAFSASFSKLMNKNELTSEEQSQLVQWVGTRMRPIEQLVEDEKLVRIDDSKEIT